jgi:hypothetical protein
MSRSLGNIIADSLQLSMGYAERLLRDVPKDQCARVARVGGVAVDSNHPAFIYGHLSLYAPKVLWQLSAPTPPIPAHFENLFSKDASCKDDPDLYPPMDDITAFFFEGHRMLSGALRNTPNEAFEKPNPAGGKMTERFPTLGSVHAFYCGGHIMMHLGQMSAWRRMMGLGSA